MRYTVEYEAEYKGYAVVDTATNVVVFRGADKEMCQGIADRANDR